MPEAITLEAQPRAVIGKQVRQLRAEDIVPAVIFGPRLDASISIQVPRRVLRETLLEAGSTNLIEITVNGQMYNVLVRDVQRDVIRGDLLHVDFYHVALDVKITTEVRIHFAGEPELVASGQAMLITPGSTIEVECLPGKIPGHLELDLTRLAEIGDYLTVADLAVPDDVEVLADQDEVLARIDYAESLPVDTGEEEELPGEEGFDAEAVEVIARGKEDEDEI
ncbi:MAG: 50S ribosomal protein L25 [Anaerolineae bacterium]|nr:50S ribosomal protein L25 [Anaerolineae bacterium]